MAAAGRLVPHGVSVEQLVTVASTGTAGSSGGAAGVASALGNAAPAGRGVETAIGAGNDVVAPDQAGQPHDAFGNQFRMLDDVGGVADHAGNEHFALGQLGLFPHPPFVLVARIGAFDHQRADIEPQNNVDDVLERHVA